MNIIRNSINDDEETKIKELEQEKEIMSLKITKYPKNKVETHIKKKNRKIPSKTYDNPMITHFNQESHFVYDIDMAKNYLSKVNNANSLKLNESEIEIILKTINKIKNKKEHEKGEKIIYIEKKLAVEVELFMREKIDSKDELTIFLSKQLNDENDRTKISLRKLAKKYEEEKGIKKSKSTIHNYLKKKWAINT